ncbi:MAG: methyltransferase domain-containing protein [Chloroflexota bacterium]
MSFLKRASRNPRLRRSIRRLSEMLPIGGTTIRRAARSAESAVLDRGRRPGGSTDDRGHAEAARPVRYLVSPRPAPVRGPFAEPPRIDEPGAPVRSVATRTQDPPAFDIDLFEALNQEFAAKPLVLDPTGKDDASRAERARRRLETVHDSIDLASKRVLEFGCGAGYEIWYLDHWFGADATGVDVIERRAWRSLSGERTHFVLADLAVANPFPPDQFDRIVSFSVFEHVAHPYAALAALHRVLRPGGLAWISANLHRGPRASHHYRHVNFPFPHLLFEDDVFREFFRRRGLPEQGASWVNRLTWAEYENHFRRLGFRIKALRFTETDLDESFYRRFEGILGRYPKSDLTRDFFQVVLEKPAD